jgi:hypothetical protein
LMPAGINVPEQIEHHSRRINNGTMMTDSPSTGGVRNHARAMQPDWKSIRNSQVTSRLHRPYRSFVIYR